MQQQQQQQPSQMNQGQQAIMSQPPSTITVKDHLYLEDMLSWNLLATKKANFFMQQCQDPEVKQAIQKMMTSHQNHYQKLLGHLQKEMNKGMQVSQSQPLGQMNQQSQTGGMQ